MGIERKPGEVGGDGAKLKKFNVKNEKQTGCWMKTDRDETGCWMENR